MTAVVAVAQLPPEIDRMIEYYAFRLSRGIDRSLAREDLVSIGRWEAIRRLPEWRPGMKSGRSRRPASLATFLRARVRGAMLDEIRRAFPCARSYYAKLRAAGWAPRSRSLETLLAAGGRRRDIADPRAARPEDAPAEDDFWRRVMRGLTRDEKRVIEGVHRMEMTQAEVARDIRLSPSRVTDLYWRALGRMRRLLADVRPEDLLPVDRRTA